jgi:hypothetical protein
LARSSLIVFCLAVLAPTVEAARMRVITVPEEIAQPEKPPKARTQRSRQTQKPRPARQQRTEPPPAAAPSPASSPAPASEPPGVQRGASAAQQSALSEAQLRQATAAEEANRLSRLQMWLGAAGAVLLLATLIYSTRMTWAAKRSADVAERALTDLEGPHLYLSADSGYSDGRMATMHGDPSVFFAFKNYGRTPAVLTKLKASLLYKPEMPLTPPSDFAMEKEGRFVIGEGETTFDVMKERFCSRIPLESLSEAQQKTLEQHPSPVLFCGLAEYESVFGDRYVFAWGYRPINGRGFAPAGGKAFNYRIKLPRE